MTEQKGDVFIEAEHEGQRCLIIGRIYWHRAEDRGLLAHNVFLSKGFIQSISAVNLMENLENAVTPYGSAAQLSDKEEVWENIRKAEFPKLPTRINALFLLESENLAERLTTEWFGNQNRRSVAAQIIDGSRTFRADAKWLDGTTIENAEDRARRYWPGEMTPDPVPEIIVCGLVYFPDWQDWARLMGPKVSVPIGTKLGG